METKSQRCSQQRQPTRRTVPPPPSCTVYRALREVVSATLCFARTFTVRLFGENKVVCALPLPLQPSRCLQFRHKYAVTSSKLMQYMQPC